MDATFAIAGRTISLAAIIVIVALVQWLVFGAATLFTRQRWPKRGLRRPERNLLISSAVMAVIWIAFAATTATKARTVTAAAISPGAAAARGTCATLDRGVTADEARTHLGKPDEVRSEEAIRGPAAEAWIYRDSRCAVHLMDGKVEFVE